MAPPQGMFHWPGLDPGAVISGAITLSHGISPSVCTINAAPVFRNLQANGTLRLSYGGRSIAFPGARLTDAKFSASEAGQFVSLTIQDRRWRWKETGKISGEYNTRRRDKIVPGTEKAPQDLAKLCLAAMGETRLNVGRMPNLARPIISWDYERPAEALARLCDELGCRIVLRLDNSVHIVPVGRGAILPNNPAVTEASVTIDPPDPPDRIVVVSDVVRYEEDFLLEAVGAEPNGTILPINNLSYRPANGWTTEEFDFANVAGNRRELAKKWIWRAYRIRPTFSLPEIPGLTTLAQILPIEDRQLQLQTLDDGSQERRPAQVHGIFWLSFEALTSNANVVSTDLNGNMRGVYPGSYALDLERGLVLFSEPVIQKVETNLGGGITTVTNFPATLYLRTGVGYRDPVTRVFRREEYGRRLAKNGTPPRYEIREDVQVHIWKDPITGAITTTRGQAMTTAQHYLNLLQAEYQLLDPATVAYAGFAPIEPDGAIQQVTWQVDSAGYATTRASRNRENPTIAMTYKEKRLIEDLARMRRLGKRAGA